MNNAARVEDKNKVAEEEERYSGQDLLKKVLAIAMAIVS